MSGMEVVYVTRTGHARALAEDLARMSGGKAAEIGDPTNRKGFLGFMRSGAQASKGSAAPFVDPRIDLSAAKSVALVQPIWASSVVPPLRSWIMAHKGELEGKKLGLLLTAQGSEGEKVKAKFEREFGPLAAFAIVYERDDGASRSRKLQEFAASLG